MFMKICPKCNTKHGYNDKCPKGCYDLARKESNQIYDKQQRKNADFYHSKEWIRLTAQCKNNFKGLDIYQLYKYKRVMPGVLSHHIEEVNDNPSRQYDLTNLIWLSDESHREIHKIYNQSKAHKSDLQALLIKYVKTYEQDH